MKTYKVGDRFKFIKPYPMSNGDTEYMYNIGDIVKLIKLSSYPGEAWLPMKDNVNNGWSPGFLIRERFCILVTKRHKLKLP